MGHTNSTPNYGLPQYVGTDIINPLVDTNGAYSDIDTALKNMADTVTASAGDVNALKITVGDENSGLVKDVTDLKAQNGDNALTTVAQNISGAVNEVNGKANTNANNITNLSASVDGLATTVGNSNSGLVKAVNDLDTTVAGKANASDVTALQTTVGDSNSGLVKDVADLQTQAGSGALDTTAQTFVGAINELASGSGGSIIASNVGYTNTTSGLSATNVQDAIDEVVTDIGNIPVVHEELQTATITAGQTSATLTFTTEVIGATTLIYPSCNAFGTIENVTYTASTVTITIKAQSADVTVGALVKNM